MKKVVLEGFLGDKYGRNWEISGNSYKHIFGCIEANYPEFRQDLIDYYMAGGGLVILDGNELVNDIEDLQYEIQADSLVITPIPEGSKSGGAKILLGALLIASLFIPGSSVLFFGAGFGVSGASAASLIAAGGLTAGATFSFAGLAILGLGINLALTGIQQLMAPDPSVDTNEQDYLFSGPQTTVASGNPVPILCGEMIIGGILMSSGIIPGTSFTYGHVGGVYTGGGPIARLVGGLDGGSGGTLTGDIVGTITGGGGGGFDAVLESGLDGIEDDIILYSANTYSKPWVAKGPRTGISYISPVVPHDLPSDVIASQKKAVETAAFRQELLYDEDDVIIGTLPFNALLFKTLDGITLSSVIDFASSNVTATLNKTLDSIELSAEISAAYIGSLNATLDEINLTSESSYTDPSVITAQLNQSLAALTVTSTSVADFIASLSGTLDTLTLSSVSLASFDAQLAQTLDSATLASAGTFEAAAGYQTESTALFARMTTEPDSTRKGHIDTLISTLKSAGVWTQLDCFFMFAAHDRQAAFLDWIEDRTAVDVGTGPNFTADGYVSNAASSGSNYLNTTVNASTYGRSSASHFGVTTKSSQNYRRIVSENAGYLVSYISTPEPTNGVIRLRFSSVVSNGGSTSTTRAHLMAVDDGTDITSYRDGVELATSARAVGDYLGTWRVVEDSAASENTLKAYCFHFGGSLTATQADDLSAAIETYLTAISAA